MVAVKGFSPSVHFDVWTQDIIYICPLTVSVAAFPIAGKTVFQTVDVKLLQSILGSRIYSPPLHHEGPRMFPFMQFQALVAAYTSPMTPGKLLSTQGFQWDTSTRPGSPSGWSAAASLVSADWMNGSRVAAEWKCCFEKVWVSATTRGPWASGPKYYAVCCSTMPD